MSDRPYLHLTCGGVAAGNVRRALALLGREEDVLHSEDAYTVGPLRDVEEGGQERARWWKGVLGRAPRMNDDCWERGSGSEVVLWHGPDSNEHLFMLRACSKLHGATLHEVALPPGHRKASHGAVWLTETEEVAAHWSSLATIDDVAERAARWMQLRDHPEPSIRLLEDGAIQLYPEAVFDDALLASCKRSRWTKTSFVLVQVFDRAPVGDLFLFWRLKRMVEAGILEWRGSSKVFRMQDEVRLKR